MDLMLAFVVYFLSGNGCAGIFLDQRQAWFAGTLPSYEVVHPRRVTRHRRALTPRGTIYRVPIEGRPVDLELHPTSQRLLSPGLVVERGRQLSRPENTSCFYVGSAPKVPGSLVSLATCRGLHGLIRLPDKDLLIEPIKGHPLHPDGGIPHLLYPAPLDRHRRNESLCLAKTKPGRKKNALSRRMKRSSSFERNVETLVVADPLMVQYYSNDDINTYILTVMNMVAALYHDAGIGNAINIVLVRIILLEEAEERGIKQEKLEIGPEASQTLKNFCHWQEAVNPPEETHPNHHDVAILLTRHNICTTSNEPCSALGLAEVAGMCQPARSCSINEDTGLNVAYTIAHELGHNFGMSHESCDLPDNHIMSAHFNPASPLVWSPCSRAEITRFLDQGWGQCLSDLPTSHAFAYPKLPPGAMYDADHQCRLQYGPEAEFCQGMEDPCQTLWCRHENKCVTRMEPAVDGTLCGKNMWCMSGECVTMIERPPRHGEWGGWSPWSPCSRTCGTGVEQAQRFCDNPPPANGGHYCIGERKRYRICKSQECPPGEPSFRSAQCSQFNAVPHQGRIFIWDEAPPPHNENPCQLFCRHQGEDAPILMADAAEDGTPCPGGSGQGTSALCISGHCKVVGCDGQVGSSAREDECGVCLGDGSQCKRVEADFNKTSPPTGGSYVEVAAVPAGARQLNVTRLDRRPGNYLALRLPGGEFGLNGHRFIQWTGDYRLAGTVLHYNRTEGQESIQASGPLQSSIRVMALFQSPPLAVRYEYTVQTEDDDNPERSSWVQVGWTACSLSCGGGQQRALYQCRQAGTGIFTEDWTRCNSSAPKEEVRSCNTHPCPPRWWTGPWQLCSQSCGKGGFRKRAVICTRSLYPEGEQALPETECDLASQPSDMSPCDDNPPCETTTPSEAVSSPFPSSSSYIWVYSSKWSECSRTCGGGVQRRLVLCQDGQSGVPVDNQHCVDAQTEPLMAVEAPCGLAPCPLSWRPLCRRSCRDQSSDRLQEAHCRRQQCLHPQRWSGLHRRPSQPCRDTLPSCPMLGHACNTTPYLRYACCLTCRSRQRKSSPAPSSRPRS